MIGLTLDAVCKTFRTPTGDVEALNGLSLEIPIGTFSVLVGPNGSGKSTLLDVIAGGQRLDAGTILALVDGRREDWSDLGPRQRMSRIARVHQNPRRGSADGLDVGEHLQLALLTGWPSPVTTALSRHARHSLRATIASSELSERFGAGVTELSGGQRQLLAVEMAAVRGAGLLLLDEPTASLDRKNAARCFARVDALHRERGVTVILVTHDLAAAAQIGDRLIVMAHGRIAADFKGSEKTALSSEDIFCLIDQQ